MTTRCQDAKIYHAPEFSLTQAAVDQVGVIRNAYATHFPDDPPVLAGISTGRPLIGSGLGPKRVVIGFWKRSEVPEVAWKEEKIDRIAGFDIIFTVVEADRPMFRDKVIDYAPDSAFFLRPHGPRPTT